MRAEQCDIIVAGLGAMGSATAFHLARRGLRVIGLDRFTPPHDQGSSHGQTRIIRQAYYEEPAYVPLVLRAYELWRELEALTGLPLLRVTGGVMLGHPEGVLVRGARRSAQEHALPHAVLSAATVRERFPGLNPADDMIGIYEPEAGMLFPELCIQAHLQAARQHGASLRFEEPLVAWRAKGGGVEVQTAQGSYQAAGLVWSVGAWLPEWLPSLSLQVERQTLFWFSPASDTACFSADRCPIYMWEYAPERFFYGFPQWGEGVKVARHHEGEACTPDTVRRSVGESEVAEMRSLLAQYLPAANGALVRSAVCLYTNTPDRHFLLDRQPDHPQVWLVSPCSGHGFKFSSAIGEMVADLVTTGHTGHDTALFQLR